MKVSFAKAIRSKCLECCCSSPKMVKYCSSTKCPLWPFRFGCAPESAKKKFGEDLMTPSKMPAANTPVEDLP
jgi:hypothetical protein